MHVHNSDNPYPRGSWCLFLIDVSAGAEKCNSDNDGCFQFSAALRFDLYYESKANVKLDQSGGIGFVRKWKTAAKKQQQKNKEQHNNTTQGLLLYTSSTVAALLLLLIILLGINRNPRFAENKTNHIVHERKTI